MIVNLCLLVIVIAIFFIAHESQRIIKQSGERLNDLNNDLARLRKSLEEKSILTGSIAHEIKNPLSAILYTVDSIVKTAADRLDQNHRKSLESIREFGDNILKLVSDFIELSRIESGKISSRPRKINILDTISEVTALLQQQANSKRITFSVERSKGDLSLIIDPRHLEQILFNLLHNAIKFSDSDSEVLIVVQTSADFVKITVKDNGKGIDTYDLDRIFEPYTSVACRNNRAESIGLGLSVCKTLVELYGGQIFAEGQVGHGSEFVVVLPLGIGDRGTVGEHASILS